MKHYSESGRYTEQEAKMLFGEGINKMTKITCYRENEYWSSKKVLWLFTSVVVRNVTHQVQNGQDTQQFIRS